MDIDISNEELDLILKHRLNKVKKLTESIEALALKEKQDVCDHKDSWEYDGHGHNYSIYRCNKCGKEEEE